MKEGSHLRAEVAYNGSGGRGLSVGGTGSSEEKE
jgi:hypothetical protein